MSPDPYRRPQPPSGGASQHAYWSDETQRHHNDHVSGAHEGPRRDPKRPAGNGHEFTQPSRR